MSIALTFEFFVMIFAALLLICGLFAWYMTDKLYTKAVCLYVETYELVEALKNGEVIVKITETEKDEPDDERRPDSGEGT